MAYDLMCKYNKYATTQALCMALKDKFEDTSTTKLRRLTIKFNTFKLKPNTPMRKHLCEIANMIWELKEVRHILSDEQ